VHRTVEQRVNAFNIVVDSRGVHQRPIGDFRTLNKSFLNGPNALKVRQIAVRPSVRMGVPRLQHVLVGAFLVNHHHHAEGHATRLFLGAQPARSGDEVNAFDEHVDAFPSRPVNACGDTGFDRTARFGPIQDRLPAFTR